MPRRRRQGRGAGDSQSGRAARALSPRRPGGVQGRQALACGVARHGDDSQGRRRAQRGELLCEPAGDPARRARGGARLALRPRQGRRGGVRVLPRARRQQQDRRHAQPGRPAAALLHGGRAGNSLGRARDLADAWAGARHEPRRPRKRGDLLRVADAGPARRARVRQRGGRRKAHRPLRRMPRPGRGRRRRRHAEPRVAGCRLSGAIDQGLSRRPAGIRRCSAPSPP